MSFFNTDCKFYDNQKYTIYQLCKEIKDEYYATDSLQDYDLSDSLYNKFKSPDESGLINKLQKHLNFDIEQNTEKNPKERFDMLRILKLLYKIEKEGPPKKGDSKYAVKDLTDARLQIINILANPRLENINSNYSNNSLYGMIFDKLFDDIKGMIDADSAKSHCDKYDIIENKWLFVTLKLFDYVVSDRALIHPENAAYELDRINTFLNNKILNRLDFEYPFNLEYKDGILKNFFSILNAHKLLCFDNERIDIIYNKNTLPQKPVKEYTDLYLKYEDYRVPWDFLEIIELQLLNRTTNEDAIFILNLVSYFQDIDESDIKHYIYALKHVKNVSTILEKHKGINFSEGINLSIFVAIMQEIIDIKRNKIQVKNKYYGRSHTNISLKSCIAHLEDCNPILKLVLISRIDNRFDINYGSYELLEKKYQIELTLYKIKEIILNYRNLDDLITVNDFIYRFVSRSLFSKEIALNFGNDFHNSIREKLIPIAKNIVFDYTYCNGIVDFYRELFFDKKGSEDLANYISEQINNFLSINYFQPDIVLKHNFKLNNKDFLLKYIIDKKSNRFICLYFFEVAPNKKIEEASKLGLDKFFII